uniref:Uncharacterized protein n=1 Tax=Arundo donax TaxID=35708 RepID=A0A0A9GT56_ARUDO
MCRHACISLLFNSEVEQ